MAKFIKLTGDMAVNVDRIAWISPQVRHTIPETKALIWFSGNEDDCISVHETREQILALIERGEAA